MSSPFLEPMSFRLSDSLYLVQVDRSSRVAPPVKQPPVHHIVVIDCSGSMANDLPAVRLQLKNKLARLLAKDDLVSLIWFSGKDQYGALVESEPVGSVTDLAQLHKTIDRWLKPVGMTGFKEPLEKAHEIILSRRHTDEVFSLFFMSDGCDNQWPKKDIMVPLSELAKLCSSSTFVEYGYYADRAMLASMAEKAGGVHVFAQDFPAYEPIFETSITKGTVADQKISLPVQGEPTSDKDIAFTFDLDHGDLFSFGVVNGAAMVSDRHRQFFYFSKVPVGTPPRLGDSFATPLYAALSLYTIRMRPDLMYAVLKQLGDIALIKDFASCFGKQKYTAFMQRTARCVFSTFERATEGCDGSYMPDDDAFTVFDLLQSLNADDSCRLLLDHPSFKYSPISRARIATDEVVPADARKKLTELSQKLADLTSSPSFKKSEVAALQLEITTLNESISKTPRVTYKIVPAPEGYPINDLVWNEERPNLSLRVKKNILLDLQAVINAITDNDALKATLLKLPNPFPSYIWRNYSVIKDGLINVSQLPLSVTSAKILGGLTYRSSKEKEAIIDLESIAILNCNMVKAPSALSMFQLEWKIAQLRAVQKVYNHYLKEVAPKTSKGYSLVYGEQVATFLQSLGITDYNGYNPPLTSVPSTDVYYSKTLAVSLKGYSSLPTIKETIERMAAAESPKGKPLTGGAALMAPAIREVQAKMTEKQSLVAAWIEGEQKSAVAETRMALLEKAKLVFTIVVGQVWFKEWSSLEENTMKVNFPGMAKEVEGKIEMTEEEIAI